MDSSGAMKSINRPGASRRPDNTSEDHGEDRLIRVRFVIGGSAKESA